MTEHITTKSDKNRGKSVKTPNNKTKKHQRTSLLLRRATSVAALGTTALATIQTSAWAAGSSMPWEGPLTKILQSIEGPVAKIISVMIIISTGLALAFGDSSGGVRRLIQIVFGLSIAFAASSFFLSFFSFSGGALIP